MATLIALLLLSLLASWIWFHGLALDIRYWPERSLLLWDRQRVREYITQNERVFDAAFFFGGLLLVALLIGGWRTALRFAHFPEERLAPWASQLELKDRLQLENDLRASRIQIITTAAQFFAGTALLVGIYFAWANLTTTREGQITDRFVRAIDQLGATDKNGNPAREIRLGGIYGLRRIARESHEDYEPVRRILNDYVRLNAPLQKDTNSHNRGEAQATTGFPTWPPSQIVKPRTDIQAAIDFLGAPIEKNGERILWPFLNLSFTDLRGVDLENSHLDWANLTSANLTSANLYHVNLMGAHITVAQLLGADLTGAILVGADLTGAGLYWANLAGAILTGANVTGANVTGANVTGANVTGANVTGANVTGANVTGANVTGANLDTTPYPLTQDQIDSANGDETTKTAARHPHARAMEEKPETKTTPIAEASAHE